MSAIRSSNEEIINLLLERPDIDVNVRDIFL